MYERVLGRTRARRCVQARVAFKERGTGRGRVNGDVPGRRPGVVNVIEGDGVPLARNVDGVVRFEGAGGAWAYRGPGRGPARENEAGGTGDAGEEGGGGGVPHGLSG